MKFLALFLTTALVALLAGTAGAADPAPTFNGCGAFKKDSDKDASDTVADPAPDEVEIEAGWVQYEPAGPTFNVQIKNLTGTVPPPATSITYNAIYGGVTQGVTNFVRAHIDFAGQVAFEYGHTEPLATSTRYAYDGPTKGKLFTGAHGVAQIVIPPEGGGKPGQKLTGVTAQTQLGRTTFVPSAGGGAPSRGLSFQDDDLGIGNFTVAPCAGGTTTPTNTTTTAPTTTTTAPPPSQQSGPLPVKLVSKTIKKAKKGKKVKIKLKTSEPLTDVAVRIAKGSSAYGTGKLAKLTKTGTVKVKLTKSLKKGTYSFDVAGTDSKGARRVGSLKLKVK